jgi:hypothetical protein
MASETLNVHRCKNFTYRIKNTAFLNILLKSALKKKLRQ